MNQERDKYWDCLKFALIFLVVYGHTIEIGNISDGSFNRGMYNSIFLFHMPLFVFVSGRFSHISDREKYKSGIFRIFETYILVQAIMTFVPAIINNSIDIRTFISFIISPGWTLWYLLSLIYWRIMIFIIPHRLLMEHKLIVLLVSIFIGIFGGFVPIGSTLAIQKTMAFLPFFIAGYYSTQVNIRNYINKIPRLVAFIVLCAAFLVVFFFCNFNIGYVVSCSSSFWYVPEISPWLRCGERITAFIIAVIFSFMFMRIVFENEKTAKYGTKTLFIYIGHSFIVSLLKLGAAKGYIPTGELLLFAYSIVIVFVLVLLARIQILNNLLNPISYMGRIIAKNK